MDGTQTNINKLKGGWNASTITNRWVEHTATTATNSLVENINNKQVQGRNTATITSTTGGSKVKKKKDYYGFLNAYNSIILFEIR